MATKKLNTKAINKKKGVIHKVQIECMHQFGGNYSEVGWHIDHVHLRINVTHFLFLLNYFRVRFLLFIFLFDFFQLFFLLIFFFLVLLLVIASECCFVLFFIYIIVTHFQLIVFCFFLIIDFAE